MSLPLAYVPRTSLSEEDAKRFPTCTHVISPTVSIRRVSTTPKRLSSVLSSTSNLSGVLSSSDISPGVYEGGFTCWECSRILSEYLLSLDLNGKIVLELGCGHGLPGITALRQGAAHAFFLDFNEEVIKLATFPNIVLNDSSPDQSSSSSADSSLSSPSRSSFIAGDWNFLLQLVQQPHTPPLLPDVILASETVYRVESFPSQKKILQLFLGKNGLKKDGCAIFAGRSSYFGVGGGITSFATYLTTLHSSSSSDSSSSSSDEEEEVFDVQTVWTSPSFDHTIIMVKGHSAPS